MHETRNQINPNKHKNFQSSNRLWLTTGNKKDNKNEKEIVYTGLIKFVLKSIVNAYYIDL